MSLPASAVSLILPLFPSPRHGTSMRHLLRKFYSSIFPAFSIIPRSEWDTESVMPDPSSNARFVVTLLGSFQGNVLAEVASTLGSSGFLVGTSRQLAYRKAASPGSPAFTCIEIAAHGPSAAVPALRAPLDAIADARQIDIVLQPDILSRRDRRLFAFDMDSTLIQGEVIDELAALAGVGEQVSAITAAAMRGELQFQESFRRRIALLKGLPESRVLELLGRIPIMHGAERLFRALKRLGIKTAVLSGGFTFFGSDLQTRLGVDFVHANLLEIASGLVTGQVTGPIVDGARKAELLVEIAAREGVPLDQVVAVGDGANDLPMLRLAGLGVAFHAKPIVRQGAACSMTYAGLDGLLYLMGLTDYQIDGKSDAT
jgi:phosphoserine phosphatase